MKWFHFSCGTKKDEKGDMELNSFGSYSNTSTDYGLRRSGSGLNSQNISDVSVSSVERPQYPNSSERPKDLRIFTYPELKTATRNFSRSTMVGEGGFGCVYRGIIKDPEDSQRRIEIAVKQLSRNSQQGHKEWSAEVNVLGIAEHPNLVKLIGYCTEDDERGIQRLLVYEFMPNKSVFDHLSSKSPATLSWQMRLKAALDAARGLTYLHEEMDFQIIFRDFKTSNILLDEEWNAKLSDFGLARHGPAEGLSHVSTTVVGTPGYAAPEYMQTGRLTAKSDVWSYGVVLYELITGRPPIDKNRPKGEQKLLEWIRPYLSDSKRFRLIVDPRLDGQYTLKSALKLGVIANKCLMRVPKTRPKMSQVMEMVKEIVDSTVTGSPQPPLLTVASKNNALEESKAKKMKQKETCFREGKRVYLKRKISQLKVVEEYLPWRLWKTKRGTSS